MQRNPHSYQIATGYRTFYSLSLIYQPITKKRLFFVKKMLLCEQLLRFLVTFVMISILINTIMITEKLQNAINEQITAEMWSSNLYLAMSFYMEKEGYNGIAAWLKKQASEEKAHACEMASYIIKRGGKAKLDKIDVVPNDFGTPLEVFEQVYEHECRVSKMIDALVDVAAAEKDKATQDFLWGFVREQVEEEATAAGIVDMVKKAGTTGIFFVDAKLGERK